MKSDKVYLLLYGFPSFFFITLFVLTAVIGTVLLSFSKGFENYARLISDPRFTDSLWFTVKFALVSVPFEITLGLILALIVNEKFRYRGLVRGLILIPWAIPAVVSARMWQLVFNYTYGVLNSLSDGLLGVRINWFGEEHTALLALAIADTWRTAPFVALIILAGLQTLPEEVFKQALVDGAGLFKRFFFVTLPLLKPFILIAVLFRGIDALRVFDLVFVLTGGGPGGSTTPLSLYAYKFYLVGDFGYASALSSVLFVLCLFLSFAVGFLLKGSIRG